MAGYNSLTDGMSLVTPDRSPEEALILNDEGLFTQHALSSAKWVWHPRAAVFMGKSWENPSFYAHYLRKPSTTLEHLSLTAFFPQEKCCFPPENHGNLQSPAGHALMSGCRPRGLAEQPEGHGGCSVRLGLAALVAGPNGSLDLDFSAEFRCPGGYPNSWMVFRRILLKWMIRGTPISGHFHIWTYSNQCTVVVFLQL